MVQKNCYVVNNTLYFNNRETGAFGEIEGEIRLTENCFDNVIRNNIVYARPVDVFVHKYTATGSGNIIDNNLYFTSGEAKWIWNGTAHTSFESWQAASGSDAGTLYATDPLLTDTNSPDLRLQPASPAKNTGFIISASVQGEKDIDGNPRIVNNKISRGAQQ